MSSIEEAYRARRQEQIATVRAAETNWNRMGATDLVTAGVLIGKLGAFGAFATMSWLTVGIIFAAYAVPRLLAAYGIGKEKELLGIE